MTAIAVQKFAHPWRVDTAESTAPASRSATKRNGAPVLATCAGTSCTIADSSTPIADATSLCGNTGPKVSGGCVIQNKTRPCSLTLRTLTGPTFSSRVKSVASPETMPSSARTQAVPMVGWPANGSSAAGVKMRTFAACLESSGGSTKVVSEKFISCAIRCMVLAERSLPSRTTASWLPARGLSVKTSTIRIGRLMGEKRSSMSSCRARAACRCCRRRACLRLSRSSPHDARPRPHSERVPFRP